jgi:hypothetical protein
MAKKIRLEPDALSVTSFDTTSASGTGRGTVRGREDACTCALSCLCETAAYYCATAPATVVSCNYTQNDSCFVSPNPVTPETLGC